MEKLIFATLEARCLNIRASFLNSFKSDNFRQLPLMKPYQICLNRKIDQRILDPSPLAPLLTVITMSQLMICIVKFNMILKVFNRFHHGGVWDEKIVQNSQGNYGTYSSLIKVREKKGGGGGQVSVFLYFTMML